VLTLDEIRTNLAAVNARIEAACKKAGRRREEVTLVSVSKTFPAEAVTNAIAAGATHIGENKVQEAREKKPLVQGSARWHLIGHLQSNKAKDAVRLFDVIETVDSVELAEKIAKAATAIGKRQEILLQVNVGREEQKSGAEPNEVPSLVRDVAAIDGVSLRGLMAIPPFDHDPRQHFRTMRELQQRTGVAELSMGMSEDFEIAIEEGSTIVRVGRAIFGARG
jgi:hypothetical protein